MSKFEKRSDWALRRPKQMKDLERVRHESNEFFEELIARCQADAKLIDGIIVEDPGRNPMHFSIQTRHAGHPGIYVKIGATTGALKVASMNDLDNPDIYMPAIIQGDLAYVIGERKIHYKDMPEELITKVLEATTR